MRLELTVTEDIIKNKFDIDDKYNSCRQRLNSLHSNSLLLKCSEYNSCRQRLNRHVLVASKELYNLWEEGSNYWTIRSRGISGGKGIQIINVDK